MNLFNKYFQPFVSDYNMNLQKNQERIELMLNKFTSGQVSEEETVSKLSLIDDTLPLKWIIHHWKLDLFNYHTSQELNKKGKNVKVYKYFEEREYGYFLFEKLYSREFIRVGLNDSKVTKGKIFNLSTLLENENSISSPNEMKPKVTSTIFYNHKNTYLIYDFGILKPYFEGEIWDSMHSIYSAPFINKKSRAKKFSVSQGTQRIDYYTNYDGSRTTVDNKGNVEIVKPNGTIEISFADGSKIVEYMDGTIDKWCSNGKKIEIDYEGKIVKSRKLISRLLKKK